MNYNKSYMVLIFFLWFVPIEKVSSQYVKMVVSDFQSTNIDAKASEFMMKNMKVESFYTQNQIVFKVEMMDGMIKNKTFVNTIDSTFVLYLDIFGKKTKVIPTAAEQNMLKNESIQAKKNVKIERQNEVKQLLGYNCTKYFVQVNDTLSITLFTTNEINLPSEQYQGLENIPYLGFPLEYTINSGQNIITFATERFEKSFDLSELNEPKEAYDLKNYTEFRAETKGY